MKPPKLSSDRAALAFNGANAAARAGDWAAVIAGCDQALALDAGLIVAALLRARARRHLGQLTEALAEYRAVLQAQPLEFTAALEGGNLARRLNDTAGAIDLYGRAVQARPDDPRGHLSLARALDGTDRGARHYHRALDLVEAPNQGLTQADVHHLIGVTRLARGDAARALDSLRAAITGQDISGEITDPQAEILIDLGDAQSRIGLTEQAAKTWEIAARATGWPPLRRLSEALFLSNRWQDALLVLRRAQSLHPQDRAIALALMDLLEKAWQLDEALALLDRAEAEFPDQKTAYLALRARILGKLGDVDGANALYETLIDQGNDAFCASLAMSMLYSTQYRPEQIAARQAAMFGPWGLAQAMPRRTVDRPRIGFVTGDLHHQHPVNIFLQPMLTHWDQARHPVTIFNTGKSFDDQTRLARSKVGAWHDLGFETLAQTVTREQVDILIDLAGHTSAQTMAAFAKRLAPVQVSFLGYPGSTGVPNIDWLVGDAVVTPPDHDSIYSERILRLPQTVFCFAPETDYPLPDVNPKRPLTFGSFNNIPKLTQTTLALWAQILRGVPGSRLLLKAPSFSSAAAADRIRRIFADHDIDAARLIFRGPSALAQMMAEYGDVDIALDPMPYNGGTTTLQAMWMGVPVVTLAGDYFVSRMGASFMTAAGLPDWVASDPAEYVQIAVHKAGDRAALQALKSNLRAQLVARPAWNIQTYTRGFQDGLDQIWQAPDRTK